MSVIVENKFQVGDFAIFFEKSKGITIGKVKSISVDVSETNDISIGYHVYYFDEEEDRKSGYFNEEELYSNTNAIKDLAERIYERDIDKVKQL